MDYRDKSTLINLNLCLAIKQHPIALWKTGLRRSLKDKVREGPPKTAVVSENIAALRELIMQDRHVIYRVIKASICQTFQ